MSPDTIQNIVVAAKLLVEHNFYAIIFFIGIIISTIFALYKPQRAYILFMIGFSLLLLGFEYQKHIKEALFEQTRNSVITERPSYRLERVMSVTILKIAPIGLSFLGGASILAGSILLLIPKMKREYNRPDSERKRESK